MVDQAIYKDERALGFGAAQALANTRTREEWEVLGGWVAEMEDDEIGSPPEGGGGLRLRLVLDMEHYDTAYLDTWEGVRECDRERLRSELFGRIEHDGLWGMVGEYYSDGAWEQADSCWGFVGDDWKNSGYDTDIMRTTIEAYREHALGKLRSLACIVNL